MILAFIEDGTLALYENEAAATRAHEQVDVESGSIVFYSDDGTPLAAHAATPAERGRWLGLFPWVSSGAYQLKPAAQGVADPLSLALHETVTLDPNPWFASLDDLKRALRQRGVIADTST